MVLEPPSGRRGVIQAGEETSGDGVWRRQLQRSMFSNRRVVGGGDNEETTPPPRLKLLENCPSGSTAGSRSGG